MPNLFIMNNRYLFKTAAYSLLLYIALGWVFFDVFDFSFYLFTVNLIATVVYFSSILLICQKRLNFSISSVLVFIFFHNLVFVSVYNAMFFIHHGDFFAFAAADSIKYDTLARKMASTTFGESFRFLPTRWDIDNYGFPFFVAFLYKISDSSLIVDLCNIILNTSSAFFMYKIGSNFLTKKNACAAALIFGLSTYSIFFQASGLKETLIIFLLTTNFYFYYKYARRPKLKYAGYTMLTGMSLFLFRVPLFYFVLFSFFVVELTTIRYSLKKMIMISAIALVVVALLNAKFNLLERYFFNIVNIVSIYESKFDNPFGFVYVASIISGFLGPFPTIVPVAGHENISVYAGSLILKVFLSIYFICGIFIIIKKKDRSILPVAVFCLSEILCITAILESFEFRLNVPHIPFVILTAVYAFQKIHGTPHRFRILKQSILLYDYFVVFFIFFWNYLRLR